MTPLSQGEVEGLVAGGVCALVLALWVVTGTYRDARRARLARRNYDRAELGLPPVRR